MNFYMTEDNVSKTPFAANWKMRHFKVIDCTLEDVESKSYM